MPTKKATQPLTTQTSSSVKLDRLTADNLQAASQSIFKAAQQGNILELTGALAPDFSFIDERGGMFRAAACAGFVQTKVRASNPSPERLKSATEATEKMTVNYFEVRDLKEQNFGGTVIQTMLYSDNVTVTPPKSKRKVTFDRNFRWTNTWAKMDDVYKLVMTQLTPIGRFTK